ncbi:MAG: thermonuclease family protein [Candidatus Neomarinimicrobiota bacterium]
MNYKIIKGKFHVVGYSPDGDSIRFAAENDANWDFFSWKKQSDRKCKKKQIRFEAIDALETHYEESHQPRAFGIGALENLLDLLGIRNVVYNLILTKIVSAEDGAGGFIASQSLDVYNRPISLVFSNDVRLKDGDEVPLADLPMTKCVNLKMAKIGLAYPTFYSSMEDALLELFTKTAQTARKNRVGLWALDKTGNFTIWNTTTITDDIVILPKLFRRLTIFFQNCSDFDQLDGYLNKQEDRVLIRSTGQKTKFADLLKITGRNIQFSCQPEDLIFDPKG